MTLRQVTTANGAPQLVIPWDGGSMTALNGQVVDIPPGSALESAYGLANLTSLGGTAAMADDQQGDGGQATDDS